MKIHNLESHPYADIFPMIETQELENLKSDIIENGLLQPIILYENKILDGRNRYRAITELGLQPKFEEYKGDKPLEYVISLNLNRRHLTKSQAGVIALDILPKLEEEARKRQENPFTAIGNKHSSTGNEGVPQKVGEGRKDKESATKAAKLFNVNSEYIRKAKKLKEKNPELLEEVRLGHKNFSQIKKEQRIQKIEEQRKKISEETIQQPTGKYEVIVIDPPWQYSREGSSYDPEGNRAMVPYPEMSMEELKKIKLPAKEDCVLWLWTTNAFMKEAYELLEDWGFQDKTILTWNKVNMGAGWWLRNVTEHCILAIKGEPRKKGIFKNESYTTIIEEKRTQHSKKPEVFYELVNKVCVGRKLDYFARNTREGWDVYGDEVNGA